MFGGLALALLLVAAPSAAIPARVAYVSDGDTIRVDTAAGRDTIRLIGIDAPEVVHGARSGDCGGPEATQQLRRLLPLGSRVTLVPDPTQDLRDRYGRLLAYVFPAGRRGPAGSVNYAMVTAGTARAYVYDRRRPFRRAALYSAAERVAIRERRGLWSGCRGVAPAE